MLQQSPAGQPQPAITTTTSPGASLTAPVVRLPPVKLAGVTQLSSSMSSVGTPTLMATYASAPLSSRTSSNTAAVGQVQVLSSSVRTARTSLSSSTSAVQAALPMSSGTTQVVRFISTSQASMRLTRAPSGLSLPGQASVMSARSAGTPQGFSSMTLPRPTQAPRPADIRKSGSLVAERSVSEDEMLATGNLVRNEALEAELRRKAGLVPGAIVVQQQMRSPPPTVVEGEQFVAPLAAEPPSSGVELPADPGLIEQPRGLLEAAPQLLSPATGTGASVQTDALPEDRSPQTEPPEGVATWMGDAEVAQRAEPGSHEQESEQDPRWGDLEGVPVKWPEGAEVVMAEDSTVIDEPSVPPAVVETFVQEAVATDQQNVGRVECNEIDLRGCSESFDAAAGMEQPQVEVEQLVADRGEFIEGSGEVTDRKSVV